MECRWCYCLLGGKMTECLFCRNSRIAFERRLEERRRFVQKQGLARITTQKTIAELIDDTAVTASHHDTIFEYCASPRDFDSIAQHFSIAETDLQKLLDRLLEQGDLMQVRPNVYMRK